MPVLEMNICIAPVWEKVTALFLSSVAVLVLLLPASVVSAEPIKNSDHAPITKEVKPPTFTAGYEKGEIVVKYDAGINITEIKAINLRMNVRIKRKLPMERSIYLLALPTGKSVKDAIGEFSAIKEVEYARPNYIYRKKRLNRAR